MNRRNTLNPAEFQNKSDGMSLLDLWNILKPRRFLILAITALFLAGAITACILSTREYQATGEIQVQKDSSDALGLDSLMGAAAGGAGDALEANVTLQTQAKILESETLGLEVANKLALADTKDFKPRFSLMGWLSGLLSPAGVADAPGAVLNDSPNKRDRVFNVFKANTKVSPVAGTRLIEVSYTSQDPKLAAAVVNELINSLIDYNFQTRYAATSQASDWLGKQLSDLRGSSEQLQAKVAGLQRDSGVFTFGGEDIQGKGIAYSTVLDRLQQATVNLTQAQENRVIKGALYEAAKAGDPEMVSGLSNSSLSGTPNPALGNALLLIQTLRTQEATEKGQISEAAAKFGSAYPKLDEMKANLASIEQSISAEQGRLERQTLNDYTVAQQVEGHMRDIFTQQTHEAEALNDKAIQYEMVHQEAEQSRGLYERLLGKLKEAGVLEGLKSSNITIVEPGRVPSRPAKPNVKLYLFGSILCGLFLGVMVALGLSVMDSKVRDLAVMTHTYGDALFGELPYVRTKSLASKQPALPASVSSLFTMAEPGSAYSEALRALRTTLFLARGGSPPKVLLVTSSIAGEGKSTLAANLAALLAQQGKRVLLVDADLRRPRLHTLFAVPNVTGLSSLLTNEAPETAESCPLQAIDAIPNLSVLTAGPIPPYPAELLGSDQMSHLLTLWRDQFDFVILDAAPALPVTDSVVLSLLTDQILLVVRYAATERSQLERSYRLLASRTISTPIGIVVNAIRQDSDAYAYDYAYRSTPTQKGLTLNA